MREWLGNQAAGGYVVYDPADGTFELPAEQAMVVADEDSPVFLGRSSSSVPSRASPRAMPTRTCSWTRFVPGAGVGWQEHDDRMFSGVLRLFRPGYAAHLVDKWLASLDGVVEKLREGASVADVGCGLGASTIIMAQAFGLTPAVPASPARPRRSATQPGPCRPHADRRRSPPRRRRG